VYLFYLAGTLRAGVLATKNRYSINPLSDPLYVREGVLRAATEADFEKFRVALPSDFQQGHLSALFFSFLQEEKVPVEITRGFAMFLFENQNRVIFDNGEVYEFISGVESGDPRMCFVERRSKETTRDDGQTNLLGGFLGTAAVIRQGNTLLWKSCGV
jgi:hypothetical protein